MLTGRKRLLSQSSTIISSSTAVESSVKKQCKTWWDIVILGSQFSSFYLPIMSLDKSINDYSLTVVYNEL